MKPFRISFIDGTNPIAVNNDEARRPVRIRHKDISAIGHSGLARKRTKTSAREFAEPDFYSPWRSKSRFA